MLEAPEGGAKVLLVVLCLVGVVALLVTASSLSQDATERTAATTNAQIMAEWAQTERTQIAEAERTERERLSTEVERQSAVLRAEQDARTTNTLSIIGMVTGGVLLGLLVLAFFLFGMNWASGQQLQRTLLLIEAQREARMPLRQPDAETALIVPGWRQRVEHG